MSVLKAFQNTQVAVALRSSVYLWNAGTGSIEQV